MKNYKITIPKPCHEDWTKMTPNNKGRFCSSCSKTVVDFTQKSAKEIQEFFKENQGKRVCGHFKRTQLDSIILQIPETIFHQPLSFQKLFILALLFAMGTTSFSCKKEQGTLQKIEKVELIDTIVKVENIVNTITKKTIKNIPSPPKPVIIETDKFIGEPEIVGLPQATDYKKDTIKDSISKPHNYQDIEVAGGIRSQEIDGDVYIQEYSSIPFGIVEIPPKFIGTKTLTKDKLKEVFHIKINKFIKYHFNNEIHKNIGLSIGKQRLYAQFTIDSLGYISDIKVRAPHQKLKKHTKALIQKLPQFIPGQQNGKNVSVRYTLPIKFEVK